MFAVEFVILHQSKAAAAEITAPLRPLAVNLTSRQTAVMRFAVTTLVVVAITGSVESSHDGLQLNQSGSGGVSGVPVVASQPAKIIGFAALGALTLKRPLAIAAVAVALPPS